MDEDDACKSKKCCRNCIWCKTVLLGSPITLVVTNDDFTHWRKNGRHQSAMKSEKHEAYTITKPRPGHADLVGE